MTKVQKIWLDILIILFGYVTPILILRANQNKNDIYIMQLFGLLIILMTGFFLIYKNNQNRKEYVEMKVVFLVFQILGILGVLYALMPLYIIFTFRNGINF